MTIRITHDNGNQICLSDGSVYVRADRTVYAPDGRPMDWFQGFMLIASITPEGELS